MNEGDRACSRSPTQPKVLFCGHLLLLLNLFANYSQFMGFYFNGVKAAISHIEGGDWMHWVAHKVDQKRQRKISLSLQQKSKFPFYPRMCGITSQGHLACHSACVCVPAVHTHAHTLSLLTHAQCHLKTPARLKASNKLVKNPVHWEIQE